MMATGGGEGGAAPVGDGAGAGAGGHGGSDSVPEDDGPDAGGAAPRGVASRFEDAVALQQPGLSLPGGEARLVSCMPWICAC